MSHRCTKILGTLADAGHPVAEGGRVLDFGCGNGDLVHLFRGLGYDAFGCDMQFKEGPHASGLTQSEHLRLIREEPYSLPFSDRHFDVVFSTQVLEHVQEYSPTLKEIHRVLRPGGVAFHQFPARYRPIETHVFVPFGSCIQNYAWLRLWAQLGVRKPSQRGMGASEIARENQAYLRDRTNYLRRSEINGYVEDLYSSHKYCETELLKYTRLRSVHALFRTLPILGWVVGEFHSRALLTVR
jgi:SAM-dependent methyltransferase